ncbi:MAG: amidohydrolase family protein, partial [Nitrospinota bacterium]|nr:amidohydrolase family protein [Nitrospinota bacterium]
AREGVKVVAEVGAAGLNRPEDIEQYLDWAREAGMVVPLHFGGRSVPGSARTYADEAAELDPDVVVHINGGPTSAPAEEAERLVDATSAYLEVIYTGNFKTMYDFVMLMKERDLLHRVLIGTDSPVGAGVVPLGMMRTVLFVSSLCGVPAETALAMASGTVADAYRLNTGKVEIGREADLLALDAPWDCHAPDALGAIEFGDVPAVAMIMVDGEVIAHRARNTTLTDRRISVDGKEATFASREAIMLR